MKKIIALVIAILMMAAIAVPAFAGTYDPEGENTVEVKYTVDGGYVVTIIDAVTLGEKDATVAAGNVSVSNAILEEGKTLTVTVKSTNGFTVNNSGSKTIAYSMTIGEGEAITSGTDAKTVLTVESGTATGSVAVSFARTGDVPANVAGEFTDTLTFEVAVA